jgi:hypothetical protein
VTVVAASYQWSGHEDVSAEIIAAVADATDRDPSAVQPLYTVIDPDALDALFSYGQSTAWSGTLSFELDGHRVSVDHTGEITVDLASAPEGDGEPEDVTHPVTETEAETEA